MAFERHSVIMAEAVKKKRKKCSPSHVSVDAVDRISALPDCLIHHILSFLEMRVVIRTCLLAIRWRYLWTSVPVLDFGHGISDDIAFIDRSLMLYEGRKIQKFCFDLWYKVDACHINSWIHFATRRDVEELDIELPYHSDEEENVNLYRMPQCLFDCGTLRVLRLRCSDSRLPASFSFRSLTALYLDCDNLTDLDTSSCPCLEKLIMDSSNPDTLNIYAPNQKLRYLKIEDRGANTNCGLTLYAPHLLSIEITMFFRRIYKFKNLSFIKSASLDFRDAHGYMFGHDSTTQSLVELLINFSNAKTLKLSWDCIQFFALSDRNNLKTPPLGATCLELGSTLSKSELPVIASLLTSCHCLETLIISIRLATSDSGSEVESWELLEHALSADLQIKTVVMHNFMGSKIDRPRRRPKPSFNMNKFQGNWLAEIKLVKLLLNRCNALDKMIIRTIKIPFPLLKSELLLGLTKKLLEFPRASVTAKIYIT